MEASVVPNTEARELFNAYAAEIARRCAKLERYRNVMHHTNT